MMQLQGLLRTWNDNFFSKKTNNVRKYNIDVILRLFAASVKLTRIPGSTSSCLLNFF